MGTLSRYDWIFAVTTVFFCISSSGNGANDVANSYSTSIASRTLTMPEVGVLAAITEFSGAVALGSHVMDTIRNDIIGIDRFRGNPGILMLAMGCAEVGSAIWLMLATHWGYPVSTTQTIVGALVGVGLASQASVTWTWKHGSVSQIAASWAISPVISAAFAAILFATIKYAVLNRRDPMKQGIRLIPLYQAFTASILALFIVVEAPTAPSLEAFGAPKAIGIILGVFVFTLTVAYVFFQPYFYRRLVMNDCRLEWYHIPLGPLLWKDDPWIYYPSKKQVAVIDYYGNAYMDDEDQELREFRHSSDQQRLRSRSFDTETMTSSTRKFVHKPRIVVTPRDRFLAPTADLPLHDPSRLWSFIKFGLLRGVTTDCVSHKLPELERIHARAHRYRSRVEHLWTYAQVVSAMLMSIAHGSNDVANAVGPWSTSYSTWKTSRVTHEVDTPIWMLAVAGLLFGIGFWFFGYHIIRSLGNRITQHSPTRGFSMELGAAITVLVASRLGIPVSTTQCLTGAVLGVSLMNFDLRATNWKQLLHICFGWVLTLPVAGLIAGILMLMALNTPTFNEVGSP